MEFGANVAGVVGLADKVISRCHRYLSAVKDCPSDLRAILIETSTLKSVIENLEFLCKNSPNPELKQFFLRLDGDNGPIRGSRECLVKLDRLLPDDKIQRTTRGGERTLQPTLARLAWPLHETKARKLLDELGRFRASISAALVTDISYVEPRQFGNGLTHSQLRRVIQTVDSKVQYLCDQLDSVLFFTAWRGIANHFQKIRERKY